MSRYEKREFYQNRAKENRKLEKTKDLNLILKDVAAEQPGYLEKDHEDEVITQYDIIQNVDMFSAQKYFDLELNNFGPYRIDYTKNGRHLLMGGKKGHIATFDWQTKKLHCEINVMETVNDVKWLHLESMFAVAQRQWTYIYDNQGIELHCLKVLDRVNRLEFLPYHFLLSSINACGYLAYIDVSIGKKISGFSTGLGRCDIMTHNPSNGIIHLGHSAGTVTLWSPNVKEPLVKMLCHQSVIKSLAVSKDGNYMATSGLDHLLNIWDLRNYKQLKSVKIKAGASNLTFSDKGCLAASLRNEVIIFKHDFLKKANTERKLNTDNEENVVEFYDEKSIYLKHNLNNTSIQNVKFCPYEDVLGIGHDKGISSILVPGAGEANFDALEANPYESKNQRKQWEVKALLEKIQPELISLDPMKMGKIDKKTLEEKMVERNKKIFLKPKKIDFEPRLKMKGKSKTGRKEARKKSVKNANMKEFVKEVKQIEQQEQKNEASNNTNNKVYNVFDRFKKKLNKVY